ncbi:podocan-like protein 1 isoform X2 [Panthera tigris]|uniref:podocan-like protein 1 isoform X2 n=1 Tax=Panthera tigris TaxID=9694 RepID=UPI001C6F79AF|nr:podocan-like protein 1 isoform X2 [Panthera tigris]
MRLSLLLLLLLLPGPPPTPGMEDAAFPHLGESSQPPPRACPPRCSCPRADTVDCNGLDLQVFPDNITRAAQHLSLQNNQLQELPYNELSRLSSLRTLNLHNNLISSEALGGPPVSAPLPPSCGSGCQPSDGDLPAYLWGEARAQLSNAGLPPDAFHGSEAVVILSLSSNRLSYLPPSLPPSLERLHLQNNLISKVPRGALSRQTHLRELYLQHNQLTDSGLDATTFSKLHHLEYLDLSHNRLASVPAGLPRTLAVLHLGRNRIRRVEAARLRGARGLRYLLLQHNQLGATGLPAGALRPLRGLHTLHLYGNGLDRVPLALPRRLRALVLPHNHVTTLGARDLAGTPGLAELNLAYNRLVSARVHRRAFRPLRALRSLDLAGNLLTRLPGGLPGGLHTLRLQRNQLRALEPEPLAGLDQLRELSLAHNRLRVGDIGPGTWHELQALQVLDLSHNELSFVPPDLPEALEELHLQGNRISHVGPEAFLSTPRLRALFLRCPGGGWGEQGKQASHDQHRTGRLPGPPAPECGGYSGQPRAGPDPAATHNSTSATGREPPSPEGSSSVAQTPGAPLGHGPRRRCLSGASTRLSQASRAWPGSWGQGRCVHTQGAPGETQARSSHARHADHTSPAGRGPHSPHKWRRQQ